MCWVSNTSFLFYLLCSFHWWSVIGKPPLFHWVKINKLKKKRGSKKKKKELSNSLEISPSIATEPLHICKWLLNQSLLSFSGLWTLQWCYVAFGPAQCLVHSSAQWLFLSWVPNKCMSIKLKIRKPLKTEFVRCLLIGLLTHHSSSHRH